MKPKSYIPTELLLEDLKVHEDYEEFLKTHKDALGQEDFKIALRLKMFECGDDLNVIFQRGQLKQSYAYQILNGQRAPTRDKIIQFAFGMKLGLEETNALLSTATKEPLYAKRPRDAAIIHALLHKQRIGQVNAQLLDLHLTPLYRE